MPSSSSPDNVECFLCHKALDGWEEDDDPIAEHLTHSPDCGWAIVTSLEKRRDDPARKKDPLSDEMKEARRATFAGIWPHDGKKGWACKTEKVRVSSNVTCFADSPDGRRWVVLLPDHGVGRLCELPLLQPVSRRVGAQGQAFVSGASRDASDAC